MNAIFVMGGPIVPEINYSSSSTVGPYGIVDLLYRNCMSYPYTNTHFNVRTTDIFKMFKLWKLLYILKADRIAMIQFNFNCLFQTHADTC